MGRLEIELDDISPVEMDLNEDEPDVDEGEGEGVNDGNEDANDVLNNEVADDGNKVVDDGNEADDEGHMIMPKTRKRKPSERITKLKLKKAVFDKDGGGSTCSNPLNLE
ncbi:unnamed protein product [Lactuca virosa]|uniref:Uncharacterized protein n=1 Tax=Lactuca virosa TaxID=75947 RepID=A0AAU9MIB2_9ASTR|nr:unnamed protein product [Lactuca virosa]